VGIVGDVRHRGLSEPVSYQAYIPLSQFYDAPVRLVLRTTDGAAAARIRAAVAAIDRTQAVHDIRLFEDIVSGTLDERRFLLWLVGVFGAAALVLSVIGLYGVVSYTVAQRQRDISVRMALGAARADIGRLVLRIGMAPVAIGLTAGLALVAVVTRPLEGMLFSVRRLDATAIGTAVAVLFASALIACYVPARRAMRVDPISALRSE
jgi:ABC-type antimicrobial peptide transport system permease subunit